MEGESQSRSLQSLSCPSQVAKHLKNEEKWLKDYHLACLKWTRPHPKNGNKERAFGMFAPCVVYRGTKRKQL